MKLLRQLFFLSVLAWTALPLFAQQPQPAGAEQLFALANQARARVGAGRLQWDRALAAAALKHCMRMVSEGELSHRYGGELDLVARAGAAGAHFSLVEENIAFAPTTEEIHEEWMNSPPHRENLLNPQVDRVGIVVVAARGELYAVADYARGVAVLTQPQVEAAVADLLRGSGIEVSRDPRDARAACVRDSGLPRGLAGGEPGFVMRWQGADLDHLPQGLVDRLGSRRYHQAAVGSCAARNSEGAFTVYRVAVLLY
jgi:hypothetical protein